MIMIICKVETRTGYAESVADLRGGPASVEGYEYRPEEVGGEPDV